MKILCDDRIKVGLWWGPITLSDEVHITVRESGTAPIDLYLTAKQARKLARKINMAASRIEIKERTT